jgi:hypothetical protein
MTLSLCVTLKVNFGFVCHFLSARKADLKKGFQHLVLLVVLVVVVLVVVVLVVVVVGTRVKKRF